MRFQSRSGFSPCLDTITETADGFEVTEGFNPVLGFLPASTRAPRPRRRHSSFQSRSGFSPCLDGIAYSVPNSTG